MKKIVSVLLTLAMLLSAASFASAEEDAALPAVGETVEGFTVRETRDFPLVGGTAVLFEHERTGARLMYIANDDTNRAFDLTFFTRAIDNTGLPHVFEHATLNGSEKYPSTALFFNLSYQTYNTFMNAMTYPLMTTYPVASLSEAQLLRYADFYTDSCLHPSILKDESIYREEAWRYRLPSEEEPLTIEGTVYSEMLGALDLESSAFTNMLRAAFPGSTIGNVSGGDPAYIPDMTWDALKQYHDTYYHPSNCFAFLYGRFEDYAAFLRLLDEAFAPYERKETSFEDPAYEPLTAPVEESVPFPVEASSGTEHRSSVYYAFVCPGLKENVRDEMILNTLTDVLIADASPLMQQLKKVLPYGSFACYIETEGPEDAILFQAQNVDPADAVVFRDTVDRVLADVAVNGFMQDLVDGVMASLSLSTKLTAEQGNVGTALIPTIAYSCSASGNPFDYMDYVDALENLDGWNRDGLYAQTVADRLVGSRTTALVTTYPEPGMREQLDAAEADHLAAVKAAMAPEEIAGLIAASNAEKEQKDVSEYVAMLQAVTVGSLPEEQREYAVTDVTGEDGVRRMTAEAGVDGIGQAMLLFDAAGLPQEQLHWFTLYASMVGRLNTSAHSREEVATLMTRYLYSAQIRYSLINRFGTEEFHPYLRASWIAADRDLAEGYDLVYELLYDTQFTDHETMGGLISQAKAALKSSITSAPYNAMLYRHLGAARPLYAYYDYINDLPYYAFLEQAEQAMAEDPSYVQAQLETVQGFFHNRSGAVSTYAGSAEGIETNAPLADAFLAKLDSVSYEPAAYEFEKPGRFEALIVDSGVQFNAVVGGYEAAALDSYTADLDAVGALVSDLYLMPMLREQYGVYTPLHGFVDEGGVYFVTYRDPNIRETFEVYEQLPAFLESLDADQETLDGYILSSYSAYAMPEGELSGALSRITSILCEEPDDLKLQRMRELKSLTPEKLSSYAAAYASLMENGLRFTAGGAGAINANADLYDVIMNPFGAVDASQVVMEDVPEGHEHYEAIRFVFGNMLMPMEDEARFGADDPATAGELCGVLYGLIGGDAFAWDEATTFMAANGLIPAGTAADDALTLSAADGILDLFSAAVEVPYENLEGEDRPLTRGELAEIVMAYAKPLM